MNRALSAFLACSLLGAAACSATSDPAGTPGAPSPVAEAQSSLERDTSPDVPQADRDALRAGNTAFAFDLYEALAADPANANQTIFFSPYSVSLALAMSYAGARGETATQMSDALHFTLPQDHLHAAFDGLDLALESRGKNAEGKDGQPFRLKLANALFATPHADFEQPYLDTLAVNYGAGVKLVDFATAPNHGVDLVNGWVKAETEDRIPKLLDASALDDNTKYVLVNAAYFNARWATTFDETATDTQAFTKLDGSSADVPTMHLKAHFPYVEGEGYQAISLPYDGQEISMVVVLPAAGTFATFEDSLGADAWATITHDLDSSGAEVELSLPKFKHAPQTASIRTHLEALGMKEAFTAQADFTGMLSEPTHIADVLHSAFLEVDENGTEAAAATAVIGVGTGAPVDPPKVMKVDRPFFFAIRDVETNAVLFMGRVATPEK